MYLESRLREGFSYVGEGEFLGRIVTSGIDPKHARGTIINAQPGKSAAMTLVSSLHARCDNVPAAGTATKSSMPIGFSHPILGVGKWLPHSPLEGWTLGRSLDESERLAHQTLKDNPQMLIRECICSMRNRGGSVVVDGSV